jgi:hypothetical protein
VGDETDAAGVVLVPGMVKAQSLGIAGLVHEFTSNLAGPTECIATCASMQKAAAAAPGKTPDAAA